MVRLAVLICIGIMMMQIMVAHGYSFVSKSSHIWPLLSDGSFLKISPKKLENNIMHDGKQLLRSKFLDAQ